MVNIRVEFYSNKNINEHKGSLYVNIIILLVDYQQFKSPLYLDKDYL